MIYIIITTSINNKVGIDTYDSRKQRYIDCIRSLLKIIEGNNEIKPIIVENNGNPNVYLNDCNCDFICTDNNKQQLQHKGVNELLDIKHIINQYNINDDDIIIKLTGRYKILNNNFLNIVINHMNNYDAFIKFFNVCTKTYIHDDCVLGLFAIKCKYMKIFNYDGIKSPECEFANFVRNNISQYKIMEVNDLGLECCFADDLRILIV